MNHEATFSEFIKDLSIQLENTGLTEGLLSICLNLPTIDLIDTYNYFFEKYSFSSFWEENEALSYIALDKCRYCFFNDLNKFDQARHFTNKIFNEMIFFNNQDDVASLSKVIYFFSFDNTPIEILKANEVPRMEAILPKFLIIKKSEKFWLRVNYQLYSSSKTEDLIKEICRIRNQIIDIQKSIKIKRKFDKSQIRRFNLLLEKSNEDIRESIVKGLNIIDKGDIQKIVLCKRLDFKINQALDLNLILKNFRSNLSNSCSYVWKRNNDDITFGASPEKLFSLSENILTLEAIAGTAPSEIDNKFLLNSYKDKIEHDFVINYLIQSLKLLNMNEYTQGPLEVVSFGPISHLCTKIKSIFDECCPFDLLQILHPTPAVCGLPKNEALDFIDHLESFSRDNYAAPIGWVDSNGNSDFRVAIRGARYIEEKLQFTAGSGLVKGSKVDFELQEINLKIRALAMQVFPR